MVNVSGKGVTIAVEDGADNDKTNVSDTNFDNCAAVVSSMSEAVDTVPPDGDKADVLSEPIDDCLVGIVVGSWLNG